MTDGQKVFRWTVSPVLTGFGLHCRETNGIAKKLTNSWVVSNEGGNSAAVELWHETREAALLAAADEIERLIAPAVAQVAKLRKEAAREAVASV